MVEKGLWSRTKWMKLAKISDDTNTKRDPRVKNRLG